MARVVTVDMVLLVENYVETYMLEHPDTCEDTVRFQAWMMLVDADLLDDMLQVAK